jgi:magnesium transporter
VSSGKPAGRGTHLRVPCLVDPDHDAIAQHLQRDQFIWIDLGDPQEEEIARLGHLISLHPLTVEDARTFHQRPKLEEYEGYVFMVVFGVDPGTETGGPLVHEFHLIISGDYVVTIHRRPFPALDELRKRYDGAPVRSEAFLVYKILDAITSTFVPVLSRVDDEIDDLEAQIIAEASQESLQQIFSLKRDLVAMRRVVAPMRDVFARDAERIGDLPGLEGDDRLYYRDLYDGLLRIAELVDAYRDLLSGAADLYLSTVANRQGEINKQLTIIATIFLPLTFLTGFFGQNFAFMINHILDTEAAFIGLGLGLLVVSVIGFGIFFRRKGWL